MVTLRKAFITATIASMPLIIAITITLFMDVNTLKAQTRFLKEGIKNLKKDIIHRLDRIENKLDNIR